MELIFLKSGLKNVMWSLIKDMKNRYSINLKYARCDITEENDVLKGCTKVISLNTPHQVHHNKIAKWNKSLLLCSKGYMQCSIVGNFFFLKNRSWPEAANTTTFNKNNLLTLSTDLSPFQWFFGKGKKCILTSVQKTC